MSGDPENLLICGGARGRATLLALIAALFTFAAPIGATGAFDHVNSYFLHEEAYIEGDVDHCDGLAGSSNTGRFCSNLPDDPDTSPFAGFSVVSEGDALTLASWCEFRAIHPVWAGTMSLVVAVGDLGSQTACTRSYGVNEITEIDLEGEYTASVAHLGPVNTLVPAQAELRLTSTTTQILDSVAWHHNWVYAASPVRAATINDAAGDNAYAEIDDDASRYVLSDPSGDDQLTIDGQVQELVPGATVYVGDIAVTLAADPTQGPEARTWTIQTGDAKPFLVDGLRDAGGGIRWMIEDYDL